MSSRRILVLGQPGSGKLTLLKQLTGLVPEIKADDTEEVSDSAQQVASANKFVSPRPSHAGLSHSINLSTKYFEKEVPIWVDEYEAQTTNTGASAESHTGIEDWSSSFSSDEASEVIDALGAIVLTFRTPSTEKEAEALRERVKHDVEHIHSTLILQHNKKRRAESRLSVKDSNSNDDDDDEDLDDMIDWNGLCLAVAVPPELGPKDLSESQPSQTPVPELDADDWDYMLQPFGFEFVDLTKSGRNDFGEQQGIARIREAFETHGWDALGEGGEHDEDMRQRRALEGFQEYDSDFGGSREGYIGENDDDMDSDGFDQELREMQLEMAALHFSIDADNYRHGEKDDTQAPQEATSASVNERDIEEMDRLMQQMRQVREQGEGLPLDERRKLADKLTQDLMRLL
ncbi:uncharacterized protein V1518DRAFT_340373 [Limtongia smithiae]|uniref:uncharacterized protein n=1 Tax=Limtongia smithiae TaxID=1125753 RepID=UPI0034CF9AE7